jgi:hypothetical protein
LAAHQCAERLVSLHERKLEGMRRLRLDVCVRRAVGLGMLPLRQMVQGGNRLWLGLGTRQSMGAILGFLASGQGEIV